MHDLHNIDYTVDCLIHASLKEYCMQIKNYQKKLMHNDLHVYAFSTECTEWQLKYSFKSEKFHKCINKCTTIFKPFRAWDNYICGADISSFVKQLVSVIVM